MTYASDLTRRAFSNKARGDGLQGMIDDGTVNVHPPM